MYVGDDDPDKLRLPRDVAAVRKLATRLRRGKDTRKRKVRRVKHAVQSGDYENALKLSVALDRLLDELMK
jgi:hypothetical protein